MSKKYGLRHKETGTIIGFSVSSNGDASDCVSEQYMLELNDDKMWLVDTPDHAEWVRLNSTEWYNAGYDTPTHHFKPKELEVVEVEIITNVEPVKVTLPTIREYLERKYGPNGTLPQKQHLQQLLSNEDVDSMRMGWYDYCILIDEEKRKKEKDEKANS